MGILLNSLVDAYLHWRKNTPMTPDIPVEESSTYDFSINVIDIYTLATSVSISRPANSLSTAQDLV